MLNKWMTMCLLLVAQMAWSLDPIYTSWYSNLAIKGYDPVAYFTQNKPVKGDAQFEFDWQGATWRFSSDDNRQRFINNPAKYAPQYGGYCAYAVAENNTAGIDPSQFSIVDGKLYLNYSHTIQTKWLGKQQYYIEQADKNWPALSGNAALNQ